MKSPLALIALLLWVLLFFLAVWQCRKWGKASRNEKIIYKNHPAISVKEYKLSEVGMKAGSDANIENPNPKPINKPKAKPGIEKKAEQLSPRKNVWDV